jgi:hypothetical protein
VVSGNTIDLLITACDHGSIRHHFYSKTYSNSVSGWEGKSRMSLEINHLPSSIRQRFIAGRGLKDVGLWRL